MELQKQLGRAAWRPGGVRPPDPKVVARSSSPSPRAASPGRYSKSRLEELSAPLKHHMVNRAGGGEESRQPENNSAMGNNNGQQQQPTRPKVAAASVVQPRKPTSSATTAPLTLEQVVVDPPGANEVRVRIDYATLCGTDLQALAGKDGEAHFPFVMGHSSVQTYLIRIIPGCFRRVV